MKLTRRARPVFGTPPDPFDANTAIARFRTKHVLSPVAFVDHGITTYICPVDRLRVVPRKGGWRHDPSDVARAANR